MMKKIKNLNLNRAGKIILLIVMILLTLLVGNDLYNSLTQAKRVDETLVETYQPSLNINAVKKAAEVLEEGK